MADLTTERRGPNLALRMIATVSGADSDQWSNPLSLSRFSVGRVMDQTVNLNTPDIPNLKVES